MIILLWSYTHRVPHVLSVNLLLTRKDGTEEDDPLPLADAPPDAEVREDNWCAQMERKWARPWIFLRGIWNYWKVMEIQMGFVVGAVHNQDPQEPPTWKGMKKV